MHVTHFCQNVKMTLEWDIKILWYWSHLDKLVAWVESLKYFLTPCLSLLKEILLNKNNYCRIVLGFFWREIKMKTIYRSRTENNLKNKTNIRFPTAEDWIINKKKTKNVRIFFSQIRPRSINFSRVLTNTNLLLVSYIKVFVRQISSESPRDVNGCWV